MTPAEFIETILPGARTTFHTAGIPVSFTLAQAAVESAWGKLALGNNLFGMKADGSWKGPTVAFRTTEHINGIDVHPIGTFRSYASWSDSIVDHARFLHQNPRYAPCFRESTGEGWARAVAKAGYATATNYADVLVSVIRGRNLQQYDIPVKP